MISRSDAGIRRTERVSIPRGIMHDLDRVRHGYTSGLGVILSTRRRQPCDELAISPSSRPGEGQNVQISARHLDSAVRPPAALIID